MLRPVSLLIATLATASQAGAGQDEGTRRREAEARLVEAQELYARNEDEAALAKLKEAYALFPSATLQFHFGHVYRGLGQDAKALEAYQAFLGSAPEADASLREEAEKIARQLRGRVGALEIISSEPGAEIRIDDELVGRAPLPGPVRLERGLHEVVVEKPGAELLLFRKLVRLRGGESMRIEARLEPVRRTALTAVTAQPSQAALDLKRDPAGARPADGGSYARRWWVVGGVAVALVVGAAAFVLIGKQHGESCPGGCALGAYTAP
jgi:tetratricopeptide (TPR) repeat protein